LKEAEILNIDFKTFGYLHRINSYNSL
jgi:hypothetical protein